MLSLEVQDSSGEMESAGYPAAVVPTRRDVPHGHEACYGSREHCEWHHVDEPDDGLAIYCLECRHVYRTREDLMKAWDEAMPGHSFRSWAGIGAPGCAYCGHDF